MKKITLLLLLFTITTTFSQVTNVGEPLSWKINQLSPVTPVQMEPINLADLEAEDAINDKRQDIPWRFGKELPVLLNTTKSGVWDVLENGDRIWRLNIISEGAKTLNFVFEDFYLPNGAKLYLYNDEKSDLLGAYTSSQNREDRQMGTWFVDGDNVWLEYYEPASQEGLGSIQISKVVHGYRSVNQSFVEKDLNDSGDCNLDVDCSIGTDYDGIKDVLKRSVGLFIFGGGVCTGTLINNTDNDNAPYFLTANHCNGGNPGTWAFRFNWISPNPSCATTSNSTNSSTNHTVSGATILATNPKSDFMLVNIDANLPTFWNLVWAGWNRSATEVPDFTVGIHHPLGDIMKVCRDNQSPTRAAINFQDPNTFVWQVADWDLGVTEQGSSGSALFDQDGRIVGQLAAGAAACVGTNDNGQPDFYGRFDTSWNFGTTNSTRLSNWLDPQGTGATSTDILSTPNFQYFGDLQVYPNPVSSYLYVENNNSSNLEYQIYSVTGQMMQENTLPFSSNTIDMSQLSEGIYFLKLTDKNSDGSLVKKIAVKK
ncbi:MAG: T9SS type A sorting domain-containing protein [Flavobacteriaceae bacterium]